MEIYVPCNGDQFRINLIVLVNKLIIKYTIKWYSLWGKMNQTIVYEIIQTLTIVEGSNLDFFL